MKPRMTKKALLLVKQNQCLSVAKTKNLIFDKIDEYYSDACIRKEKRALKNINIDDINSKMDNMTFKLFELLEKTLKLEGLLNA